MPLAVEAQSPNQWTVREVLPWGFKAGGAGWVKPLKERAQDEKSA